MSSCTALFSPSNFPPPLQMLFSTLEWRRTAGVPSILDANVSERAHGVLCREHRAIYLGFDRKGHPVYIEYFGATQWLKVLQHVSADEVVRAHVQQMEITHRLLYRAASGRAGRPVQRQVNILDMRGLAVGSLTGKAMELTGRIAKIDQDHYPETLEACYIINPPWAFSAAFNLVTRFLDEKTRKKVQVLPSGPDLHARLKALLGPDAHIPAALVTGSSVPDFGSSDFPAKGLVGAHEIVYEYIAEREKALARGEGVDGPRHLANSRSYAQMTALGAASVASPGVAQPPTPSLLASPPPLPARRNSQHAVASAAAGSSSPDRWKDATATTSAAASPWSTRAGSGGAGPVATLPPGLPSHSAAAAGGQFGSFRSNGDDAYSSDTDGPSSVFYDAEDDERAMLTNSAWAAAWGPGSTNSSASASTAPTAGPPSVSGPTPSAGPHWERDRNLSVKLLAVQPEAFRHVAEAESHHHRQSSAGSMAAISSHDFHGSNPLAGQALPRGRELLTSAGDRDADDDDGGFREQTAGVCCFCFKRGR